MLERYQALEAKHRELRRAVLKILQRVNGVQVSGNENSGAAQALVKLNVELKKSAEGAQQGLEEYEAITKENLKREREVLEVVWELN